MASSAPLNRQIAEVIGDPPRIDLRTTGLIAAMCVGFPLAGWLYHQGLLPAWATVLAGTLLMNLSFTAWHEPAHRNFSRSQRLNAIAGWIASFASVYPGFYARRREHLVHHRFEGIEGKDPVYPRVQSSFWTFPFAVALSSFRGQPTEVPADFLPLTRGQRIADAVSNLLALGVVALSVAGGFWPAVALVWIVPRLIVFLVHAYYICFFPHHHGGDHGFVVWRLRRNNPVLRFLTMNQHLHGIHHRWPWIPWYRYQKVLRAFPEEMKAMAAEESVPENVGLPTTPPARGI